MKKVYQFMLLCLVFGLAFSSCKKEDTPNNNNGGGNNSVDYTTDIAGVYSNLDANGSGYKILVTKANNTQVAVVVKYYSYGTYSTNAFWGGGTSKTMNSKTSLELKEWDDLIMCDTDLDPGCQYDYLRYGGSATLSGNTLTLHIDEKHYNSSNRADINLTRTDPFDYTGTK